MEKGHASSHASNPHGLCREQMPTTTHIHAHGRKRKRTNKHAHIHTCTCASSRPETVCLRLPGGEGKGRDVEEEFLENVIKSTGRPPKSWHLSPPPPPQKHPKTLGGFGNDLITSKYINERNGPLHQGIQATAAPGHSGYRCTRVFRLPLH